MSNWTKENIPDQSGKVFVVTGANSGVGFQTSLALAEKGATVIMACRDLSRSQSSLEAILEKTNGARVSLMHLDLGDLNSIKAFGNQFTKGFDRLDVLVNNAGPVGGDRKLTADGFESHFGVGHLGHFALTGLLLDMLTKPPESRVVTVGSRMHKDGVIHWEDLNSEKSYDRWKAYTQSKLCNMLFSLELGRRFAANGSTTHSVATHPGLAKTNWANNNMSGVMKIIANLMSSLTYQSAEMGALSVLYAAVDNSVNNGGYYGPENDRKGHPVETQPAENALNEEDAQRLWEISEKLAGVNYKL